MNTRTAAVGSSNAVTVTAESVDAATFRVLQHLADLDKRPATDEQLARIWAPWNCLPPETLPEERRRILTFDQHSEFDRNSGRCKPFQELRRKFVYLPLDSHEYNQALFAAIRWSTLIRFRDSTIQLHKNLVNRQWAFAEADDHAAGRIAIFRAGKEIELTRPSLLACTSPALSDIRLLESRYLAYTSARDEALAAVANLVFKFPGVRTGKSLPLDEVALGVPNPPEDVPRYLYIARLEALGICSEQRLTEFMKDDFPKLTRQKRMKFDAMRRKPRFGKNPYAAFLIWVLDNRPILERPEFGWRWNDIMQAAVDKEIECPLTCLKQWAYRSKVKLKVKLGQPFYNPGGIRRSASLLSPGPRFGRVLKQIG
jgi:hypothetical protein